MPSPSVDAGGGRSREGGGLLRRILAGAGSEEATVRLGGELGGWLDGLLDEWLGELRSDNVDWLDGD